jgi:hypothetical protein
MAETTNCPQRAPGLDARSNQPKELDGSDPPFLICRAAASHHVNRSAFNAHVSNLCILISEALGPAALLNPTKRMTGEVTCRKMDHLSRGIQIGAEIMKQPAEPIGIVPNQRMSNFLVVT